jgi:hypothetical protein
MQTLLSPKISRNKVKNNPAPPLRNNACRRPLHLKSTFAGPQSNLWLYILAILQKME